MTTSALPSTTVNSPEADPVLRVVSHTGLLYWWPVWLAGFVLSALTWIDGGRLAVVPEGTKVTALGSKAYELTVPDRPGASLEQAAGATARGEDAFPVRV